MDELVDESEVVIPAVVEGGKSDALPKTPDRHIWFGHLNVPRGECYHEKEISEKKRTTYNCPNKLQRREEVGRIWTARQYKL